MHFRKHCLISTAVYLGGSLFIWFFGPVPAFLFAICSFLYVESEFLFLYMCLNDFKKEMRVVCPHHYRNWANLMRETDFHPDKKREIVESIKKEMLQSPNKTNKTQAVVEEIGWHSTLFFLHFALMAVNTIIMAVNRRIY